MPERKAYPAIAAVLTFSLSLMVAPDPAGAAPSKPPNVIVIETDDQAMAEFNRDVMPRTFRLLRDRGTRFPRSFALPPLCCPSRAGFLTGQYPHNHGVIANDYGLLGDNDNILPAWLQAAGYRTGLVGRYLNRYEALEGASPAPGFNYWFAQLGRPNYYDYDISDNGVIRHRGGRARDYSTTVLNRTARKFVRDSSRRARPFFLWLTHNAPHVAPTSDRKCGSHRATPAPGDWRRFRDYPLPRPPSFNEADVSDKPIKIQELSRLSKRRQHRLRGTLRCDVAAMQEVDRGVAALDRTLRRTHEKGRTAIFFTSDNGFFFGEHRLESGKYRPYEEAIRVPLLARVPVRYLGGAAPPVIRKPVGNIDLAPTILGLADGDPCTTSAECRTLDGRSLVGLLRGQAGGWPDDRGLLIEVGLNCRHYEAIRTTRYLYAEYLEDDGRGGCRPGDRELYKLKRDPHQLKSLLRPGRAPSPRAAALAAKLRARVLGLRNCSGIAGRDPGPDHCE